MSSKDALPDDLSMDELKIIQAKYDLDDKSVEAIKYITQNVPVGGLRAILGEDYWAREVVKDITTPDVKECPWCHKPVPVPVGFARSRALTMFGQWIGALSNKQKSAPKQVEFEDQ